MLQKTKPIRSQKLRDSAEGEDCTVLLDECQNRSDTVVLAHLPSPDKGTAIKSPDFWSVYSCETCHAIIDGKDRRRWRYTEATLNAILMLALYRTQKRMIEKGLVKIDGYKP